MCHSQETVDIQGTFLRLDAAIKASPKYVWSKQLHIDGLEERLRTAIEPMTRYSVSRELFGEFRSYKNDSAFFYLQVAICEAGHLLGGTLYSERHHSCCHEPGIAVDAGRYAEWEGY